MDYNTKLKFVIDKMRRDQLNGVINEPDYRVIESIYVDSIVTGDDSKLKKIQPLINKVLS